VRVETDRVDLGGGGERPTALGRLGGDEVGFREVQTYETTAQRQAPAQERAPTDPSMRA